MNKSIVLAAVIAAAALAACGKKEEAAAPVAPAPAAPAPALLLPLTHLLLLLWLLLLLTLPSQPSSNSAQAKKNHPRVVFFRRLQHRTQTRCFEGPICRRSDPKANCPHGGLTRQRWSVGALLNVVSDHLDDALCVGGVVRSALGVLHRDGGHLALALHGDLVLGQASIALSLENSLAKKPGSLPSLSAHSGRSKCPVCGHGLPR